MKRGLLTILLLLFAAQVEAATYWVSKSGDDGNSCFDSESQPGTLATQTKLTINGGTACLSDGDTLMVMPGDYDEELNNPLPNNGTLRSPSSDPSTWFVLKLTNNRVANCTPVIDHTVDRTNITYKYLKWDLSSMTSGNKPSGFARIGDTKTSWTIEDFEAIGPADGMMCDTGAAFGPGANGQLTMRRGTIRNIRSSMTSPGENPGAHGFYNRGSNGLFEHLWLENGTGACMNWRSDTGPVSNNIFRYNVCKNWNAGIGGEYGSNGTNNVMHNNVFIDVRGVELRDNAQVFINNTMYADSSLGRCIRLRDTNHVVRNNIFLNCGSDPIVNSSSGSTVDNNLCNVSDTGCEATTTTAIFTDFANEDFSLLSSAAAAINAGTAISGYTYNGAAPDIGAFETWGSSATAVANGQNVDITFPQNVANSTPLLPATSITGFTLSDSRTVTAAARNGTSSNVVRLTYTGSCTGGSWTYSPGNVTDGSMIGNPNDSTYNVSQPLFAAATQSISDQCGEGDPDPPPTTGLHIHYLFEEGTGTTAEDETVNNLDGTLTGGPTWGSGPTGSGVVFANGTSDYVAVPYGNTINPSTQELVMCFDANITSGTLGSSQALFGVPVGTNQRMSIEKKSNNTFSIGIQSSGASNNTEFSFTSGTWYYICLEMDGSTATLWVDGVKGTSAQSVKSYTSYSFSGDIRIGMISGASSPPGWTVGEFRLYTGTLTDAEILDLYEDWSAPAPPPPSGATLTQTAYQFYLVRQVDGAMSKLPSPDASANTALTARPGASFIVDIQIDGTVANPDAFGPVLEYDIDSSASWQTVPDSCGSVCFFGSTDTDSAIPSGAPGSCPLSGALTCIDGGTQRTSAAVPSVDLAQDNSVVQRYIVKLGTSLTAGQVVRLRLRNQDGNALDTYSQYPTITIAGAATGAP